MTREQLRQYLADLPSAEIHTMPDDELWRMESVLHQVHAALFEEIQQRANRLPARCELAELADEMFF